MNEKIELGLRQEKKLYKICRALGSHTRIKILELLQYESLNVNEIAENLNIPVSTAASNIKVLETAGLIITNYQPGIHGSMKLCGRRIDEINISLLPDHAEQANVITQSMPIGAFTNCSVSLPCGLVSETGFISENVPEEFFLPGRLMAQLLWFSKGFVEYKFSNNCIEGQEIKEMSLSAELCSEAPKFRLDWPSDITLWINEIEIGTWTSPSDYGGRRGARNPAWWPDYNTQYGMLKTWKITSAGSFLDEEYLSGVTLHDIPDLVRTPITVRLGNKKKSKNIGGMNIFGEKFGDYAQNIILQIECV